MYRLILFFRLLAQTFSLRRGDLRFPSARRIGAVLARHAEVWQLVEHGWLLLFAIEDEGAMLHRYLPGDRWEPVE